MAYLELSQKKDGNIKIMIFVEGTVLKPKSIFSLYNHTSYIPIGNSVDIIKSWHDQGAEIVYCTSRKRGKQVSDIAELLKKYDFPGTRLYYREAKQRYKDIVQTIIPDFLIEDDCKSIGGKWQMCITYVELPFKSRIKSIIVREFKGIDHLPSKITEL
jgi:hypothetical protein